MFKLLTIAGILALSAGSPVPKPSVVTYTGTHLTPVVTDYSGLPTVHNYHAFQTYSAPLISYTGYDTPVLAHHIYGSPYYVDKYLF